jgi:hypothetical protein
VFRASRRLLPLRTRRKSTCARGSPEHMCDPHPAGTDRGPQGGKAYPSWVGMPTVEHQRRLSICAIFGRLAGWSGSAATATPTTLIHPHHFRSSIHAWRLADCGSNRSGSPSPPPLHATYNKLARLHPKPLPPATQRRSPPHHTRRDLMQSTMVSLAIATCSFRWPALATSRAGPMRGCCIPEVRGWDLMRGGV